MSTNGVSGAGAQQPKTVEQLTALKEAAVKRGDTKAAEQYDAQILQMQQKPKKDEITVTRKTPTNADAAKQKTEAEIQQKAAQDAASNKYNATGQEALKGDAVSQQKLTQMTAAMANGKTELAARLYAELKGRGAFEKIGSEPPYLDSIKDSIAEQEAQIQREAVADNVVDNVNTDDGMKRLVESYEGMDSKEEVAAMGIEHGQRKVARAARKNKEHIQRQLNLQTVYVEGESYIIDGKKMTAEEAKEHDKAQLGDAWDKKKPQVQVMSKEGYAVAKKLDEKAKELGVTIMDANGNIDIEKAQKVARSIVSLSGDRGDKNELAAVAKELGVKEKDVKAFLRGVNVDYKKDLRWIGHAVGGALGATAAGVTMGTDLLSGGTTTITLGALNTLVTKTTGGTHTTITNDNNYNTDHRYVGDQEWLDETESHTSVTTITKDPDGNPVTTVTKDPDSVSKSNKLTAGKVISGLAVGYTVYSLTSKALNAVLTHDPQILKKGATVADALEDPTKLKKKSNQEVMQKIKDFKLEGYDDKTAKQIKLALMEEAMGNNGTGKLNRRELVGVLAALKSIPAKEDDGPDVDTDTDIDTNPDTGNDTAVEPTTTEVSVVDIDGSGFINADDGNTLTDADGHAITQIGDGAAGKARGSIGEARDLELLKKRGLAENISANDPRAKAQFVIADEAGETSVVKDSSLSGLAAYEAPTSVTLSDNTNGVTNKYTYTKMSDSDVAAAKAKGQIPKDAVGPFYKRTAVTSESGANRSSGRLEIYQLELKPEESVVEEKDDKGNVKKTKIRRYAYNFEQYKGYAGSSFDSGKWNLRGKK